MNSSTLKIGPLTLGPNRFLVIAGPCAIESREQLMGTAQSVCENGASMVRGGVFKLRTHPKSFQGLGSPALRWVKEMKEKLKIPFISEITDPRQIETLSPFVDCFQVGSRNMYNYELLKEMGQQRIPVLLKRGFSALIDEWIHAAEYIVGAGNDQVILCERGIRGFEKTMRNTMDLAAVAYLKIHTSFPVIVDPSHGTGQPELIPPITRSAIACGADGIMVEVHSNPKEALSDGFQALDPQGFKNLMTQIQPHLNLAQRVLAHG